MFVKYAALILRALPTESWNVLSDIQSRRRSHGCRTVQAIAFYEACMHLCPRNPNAFQNRLLALNYIFGGESEYVCRAHAEWGRSYEAEIEPLPAISPKQWTSAGRGKLRIGYISPDLYRHSVSYFAEAPLQHHDRSRVEVGRPSFEFLARSLLLDFH
jgi:protein O-GlcNAc transferase